MEGPPVHELLPRRLMSDDSIRIALDYTQIFKLWVALSACRLRKYSGGSTLNVNLNELFPRGTTEVTDLLITRAREALLSLLDHFKEEHEGVRILINGRDMTLYRRVSSWPCLIEVVSAPL